MLHRLLERLPLGWTLRFALLRLAAQWRSLLTLIMGVLLAATIGANAPLYTAAVAQVGMVERVERQPPEAVQPVARLSLRATDTPDLSAQLQEWDEATGRLLDDTLSAGDWVAATVAGGESAPLAPRQGEDILPATRLRVAWFDGWTEAVRLVEGAFPADSSVEGEIEAALSIQAANSLNLRVGDTLTLEESGWESSRPLTVRISGLVQEADPNAVYWVAPSPLRLDSSAQWRLETNLLTTRAGFIRAVETHFPETRTGYGWRVALDYQAIAFTDVPDLLDEMTAFRAGLEARFGQPYSLTVNGDPTPVLEAYQEEVRPLAAPFSLLLLQIAALVLLFLVVIAALVRRGERREIAMLQSRGAMDAQIMSVRGLEALVICLLATLAAPFAARQILVWLTPALTEVQRLPLTITPGTFFYAGIGAGAAWVVLLSTLRPVLRQPLIAAGGATLRDSQQPWWQRAYLDVALMGVGLAGLYRLLDSDSLSAESTGEADPLLLLTPALLFLALGSLLLRLFPGLMGMLARWFAAGRGLTNVLAGWQVSREPVHYARITFLLALAVGTGWFATSFQATILRSQQDQAGYQVGADVRLLEIDTRSDMGRARPLEAYLSDEAVAAGMHALRFSDTNISVDLARGVDGDLLALSPSADLAYWRDDLGTLPAIPAADLPTETGERLPITPATIGVWARLNFEVQQFNGAVFPGDSVEQITRNGRYRVRLRDSEGTYHHIALNRAIPDYETPFSALDPASMSYAEAEYRSLRQTGWVSLSGTLPAGVVGEVWLDALLISNNAPQAAALTYTLELRDLTVTDAAGEAARLDWLAQPGWDFIQDLPSGAILEPALEGEENRLVFGWRQSAQNVNIGLLYQYPALESLPALVSPGFMAVNNLAEGLSFQIPVNRQLQTFHVAGVTRYYPTLYDETRPFLLVDLPSLLYILNRYPSQIFYPSETWLRLHPTADSGATSAAFLNRLTAGDSPYAVQASYTRADAARELETDPLALGLIGLLFLSFLIVLALSVISLLTYMALTAQARRPEFGVLRAMGMPPRSLIASLGLEQILIMGMAVLLGGVLGTTLSLRVLPTLANTATAQQVTPPFLVQVETSALVGYGLVMLGVLVTVLCLSLVLVRRLSLSQALRLGEE